MRISDWSSDVCSSDLSAAAAAATMALKFAAWHLSGSIGLLSDAFESFVNLGASLVAFLSLRWAEQPPDDDHAYGHDKAEYFSSGFEGALVFIAALAIIYAAWPRLLRSEEHTSEHQSLMRISYAVFCLKKQTT